jgi:hypothetical protein
MVIKDTDINVQVVVMKHLKAVIFGEMKSFAMM